MEAVPHPGAGEIGVALALQLRQAFLGGDGAQVEHRVGVVEFGHDLLTVHLAHRIQRHDHGLLPGQRLQHVEPVVQADLGLFAPAGAALVVPCGPGGAALGHHRGVGVQHRPVGLVADRAQEFALERAGIGQQGQRLVGVGGQHQLVEAFPAGVGEQPHAMRLAVHRSHGRAQALVRQAGQDLVHVVPRAAGHRPPLRAVVHLQQPVVVAEADYGADRELQHLLGRAAPDAGGHGQEVAVAELGGKAVRLQELAQRLRQFGVRAFLRDARGQRVEAQQVAQHAPEAGLEQVGTLGEHRVQAGAAPFQARRLDRERHVRLGGRHAQVGEQADQVGVGALVEHQEAGVHAVRHRARRAVQRDVDRVGVAAEVAARLEQRHLGAAAQVVRGGQARNAGTDDGDLHAAARARSGPE